MIFEKTTASVSESTARLAAADSSTLAALGVMAIGATLVLVTAFAPLSVVHNAAHDTRHAIVAPCH